jgi:hypothetical protein
MICKLLVQLHGGGIEPSRLTMGGVHDITNRGDPEEQAHRLYAELHERQGWG